MTRRYGAYRLDGASRKRFGGLLWKLGVLLLVGGLFWLRYHYCEHPVFNPERIDKTAATPAPAASDIEHPPGLAPSAEPQ